MFGIRFTTITEHSYMVNEKEIANGARDIHKRQDRKTPIKQVNSLNSPTAFKHSQSHVPRLSRAANEAVSLIMDSARSVKSDNLKNGDSSDSGLMRWSLERCCR